MIIDNVKSNIIIHVIRKIKTSNHTIRNCCYLDLVVSIVTAHSECFVVARAGELGACVPARLGHLDPTLAGRVGL